MNVVCVGLLAVPKLPADTDLIYSSGTCLRGVTWTPALPHTHTMASVCCLCSRSASWSVSTFHCTQPGGWLSNEA